MQRGCMSGGWGGRSKAMSCCLYHRHGGAAAGVVDELLSKCTGLIHNTRCSTTMFEVQTNNIVAGPILPKNQKAWRVLLSGESINIERKEGRGRAGRRGMVGVGF